MISDRGSIRSLTRMRSDSLPAVGSPLTGNNGSFESFANPNANTLSTASDGSDEALPTSPVMEERKITPPIPDYILNAGSRTSLHNYQARKTPSREGPSGPGLDALPAW